MSIEAAEFSHEYFERMADLEDHHPWTRHMRALTFAVLASHGTGKCTACLDVGCGTGLFLKEWRGLASAQARMSGVDFAFPALRFARTRANAQWAGASATALPYRDQSFDAIHSADVLQHLSIGGVGEAFDEFTRVLRPGGLLALRLRARRWLDAAPDEDYSVSFTTTQVREELLRRGFKVLLLSRVNALPSLAAELAAHFAAKPSSGDAPVKGIVPRQPGDPRSLLLGAYLQIERLWLRGLGIPLPWGHTMICIARKGQ